MLKISATQYALELPIYKNNEEILPTLDDEPKALIGLYVEYAELGKIFFCEFSSKIWGDNYFCTRTKEIIGISLFQKEKYQQTLDILKPIADNGSYFAQTIIGVMYANGYLAKNNEQAEYYLTLAAKQGYRIAQYNLERCYHSNQELENARYWYELSANQNYLLACENLAEIYFNDQSSIYNIEKAKFWADKGAMLKASGMSSIKSQIEYFLKYGQRISTHKPTGTPQ